ncbi:hypothetical protein Scep_008204 [Stephania cephalantha]|uniref:Uncharacterized protein n=1 Tax=Stephania cephalantha TaxID=152367 RepID=A0AAP0KDX6_9MAGN
MKPQAASYNQQQGSYGDLVIHNSPGGQQRGYGQDGYGAGYQSQASQYGQPQAGYDQSHGYNAASTYGTGVSPAQDGAGTAYGAQGGSSSLPPPQQALQSGQPPATAQPEYMHLNSRTRHLATLLRDLRQGQKPPAQAASGQTQPPAARPAYPGYAHSQPLPTQPASAQPDSSIPRPPSSGYGSGAHRLGMLSSHTPPVYPNDSNAGGSAHGSYDAAAGAQSVQQTGTVAKASAELMLALDTVVVSYFDVLWINVLLLL